MSVPVEEPVAEVIPNAATPYRRLLTAMMLGGVGNLIAILTPLQLLLTLHLTTIAGTGAAAAFGVITGVGALFALFSNPLAGRISDRTASRFGRRRTWILTGGVAGAITLVAMSFTTEAWQVGLVWCVIQTAFNFQAAASAALFVDQIPPARRGTVSGLLTGLVGVSAPLLGIAIVSTIHDTFTQWTVIAVISLVMTIVSFLLIRDPQHRAVRSGERLSFVELAKSFWLNPRKHPAFGWAWLVRFLITCGYAANTYGAFLLMDRFHVSRAELGGQVLGLSLLTTVVLMIAAVFGGWISDRVKLQKPFVIAAGVISAVSLVTKAFAPNVETIYVASGLLGLGTGLFFAVDLALCVRMLPSTENAAKDLGVINLANTLPQSFVPLVAPLLLAIGSFTALYLVLMVFTVLGALFVLRLPEIGREGDRRWAAITRGETIHPAQQPA